jgi:hypothetical protein
MEQAWAASEADYFSKSYDYVAKFDRNSFSWKTSQLSLFEGLTKFCWSSLRWGMIVDGRLYQPQKLVPRTCENGGSYLPTPTTVDGGSMFNKSASKNAKSRPTLGAMAKFNLWPTPTVCGNYNRPQQGTNSGTGLATAVKRWPTPAARDYKDGLTPKPHGEHSPSVAVAVAVAGHKGYLSPQFVEVMMGWPIESTALGSWVMEWFQCKPERLLKD